MSLISGGLDNRINLPRRLPIALLAALLIVAAVFYHRDLAIAPAYATPDEVLIALEANSIHSSGRDRNGRRFPVYFEVAEVSWFQPMAIYTEAAILGVAPFGIGTFRSATVAIAILNGALIWGVLRTMLGPWSALVGAVVLLTAPAHFIHGRLAMDYLYPLPFVLAWLWCIFEFDKRGGRQWLALAGAALGAGFFTYASALALMPGFFVLTLVYLAVTSRIRQAWALSVGAAVPLIGPAIWVSWYGEMISDTFVRYSSRSPAASGWLAKLTMYLEYLDPAFVFSDAGGPALFALRGWGLALPAAGVLFGFGLVALFRISRPRFLLVGGALLIAALPAVIIDERHATQRVLPMLPFIAVVAAAGFHLLWRAGPSLAPALLRRAGLATVAAGLAYLAIVFLLQRRVPGLAMPLISAGALALIGGMFPKVAPIGRVIGVVLVAGVVTQFTAFVSAYRVDYPVWSRILNGDLPNALARIATEASNTDAPAIYLDAYIDRVDDYWAFTVLSAGTIPPITTNYRPQDFSASAVPAGSLILVRRDDSNAVPSAALEGADLVIEIPERRGPVIYSIYRRR